jgi:RNA polymerase sigma-70 factor (ECF subfamily)
MARLIDDEELLARIGAGDLEAFEEVYARFSRRVYGFALRVTRNPEVVEEAVSDTFLAIWRSAGSFNGRSRASTWIFGVAYRKALRALERRRPVETVTPEQVTLADDERTRPDANLQRHEEARLLARALRDLPAEQRVVVELTYFHGLSYPEIAAVIECPVNTVKTRMFHARRKLRAALPELGPARPAAG